MHNYEVSQFCRHIGYEQLVNLDGGSSTQFWLNGRGPLQLMDAYPLSKDNQGPYYSRLVSSFIMLVPKFHLDQIIDNLNKVYAPHEIYLKNDDINWHYNDKTDLNKDKAFIDLSPSMKSLNVNDGKEGMITLRFKGGSTLGHYPHGTVLFYLGEDMYYPDTKGLEVVRPRLRNMMVMGIGSVLPSLYDSLCNFKTAPKIDSATFHSLLDEASRHGDFYYIKVFDGKVVEYVFQIGNPNGSPLYLDGKYHSLEMYKKENIWDVQIDGVSIFENQKAQMSFSSDNPGFFYTGEVTHCFLGAMNLDGRFLTGDANLSFTDCIFLVGSTAMKKVDISILNLISSVLSSNGSLPIIVPADPPFSPFYDDPGVYTLEFNEKVGQHVFALAPNQINRFYGLKVNCQQAIGVDNKRTNKR